MDNGPPKGFRNHGEVCRSDVHLHSIKRKTGRGGTCGNCFLRDLLLITLQPVSAIRSKHYGVFVDRRVCRNVHLPGTHNCLPVSACDACTGFDSAEPSWRRKTERTTTTAIERNSLCQFWNDSNQNVELARCPTKVADYTWYTLHVRHSMVTGIMHGVVLLTAVGAVLGLHAGRPLNGLPIGALAGIGGACGRAGSWALRRWRCTVGSTCW